MTQALTSVSATSSDGVDPNIPQRAATVPEHDVWVAASAGSGKTKVLTDRVLRLLLPDPEGRRPGAAPHKILCITFTKAAAALMALRVQKKLGEWAVKPQEDLVKDLRDLLQTEPSEAVCSAARQLFSRVLDLPSGLSVMTIHSFCQSVLGRFALEAGIAPGFTVLEEARSSDAMRKIVDEFIFGVTAGHYPDLAEPFARMAAYMDLDKLRETLLAMQSDAVDIEDFIARTRDRNAMRLSVLKTLDVPATLTSEACADEFLAGLPVADLTDIAATLAKGATTYQKNGQKIADWIALSPEKRKESLPLLLDGLLTKKNEPRSIGKKLEGLYPDIVSKIADIVDSVAEYRDKLAALNQAEQTADLMSVVGFCLTRYAAAKKKLNALDFNDLIVKTRRLMESQSMNWVHYKLDEGIDHILVDEAQDTNPHQWAIIRRLSEEFLSGTGNDQRLRSLFVVGDEKQSIFSFHGADPEAFKTMRDFFGKRTRDAGRHFNPVRLETSFRSARPVLELTDAVFARPDLAARLGLSPDHPLVHYSFRHEAAGLVELWPLEMIQKKRDRAVTPEWRLPSVSEDETPGETGGETSSLARRIAVTIWGWLQKKERLESRNRPIEPRDILILVRTRTGFVPDLVRRLKLLGVPVSGIDRMKLTDQIAVADCLALARFARFPDDDLSLACLLRSPLVRIDEEALMTPALNRKGTLWEEVKRTFPEKTVAWLQAAIELSRTAKPFDFYDYILNTSCPFAEGCSGWRAFVTCLGQDCVDPLDEFLSYCLMKEDDGVYSLEELVNVTEKSAIDIKRDTEEGEGEGQNQVRIMTVHASKGLEAPIVFLPDTTRVPNRGKVDALQWGGVPPVPLWVSSRADGCRLYKKALDDAYDESLSELMRLLYVALTRPKDRLYICGELSGETVPDFAWYGLIEAGFSRLPQVEHDPATGIRRYRTEQKTPVPPPPAKSVEGDSVVLPSWVLSPVDSAQTSLPSLKVIQPSRLDAEGRDAEPHHCERVRSPLGSDANKRFRRGTLTHKLFQILPDLPAENRRAAARFFLDRHAKDIEPEIRESIVTETLSILEDDVFAPVFGTNAMAEVPVSGAIGGGRLIRGQIDRLIIEESRILIVDFKTNRPSPRDASDIPETYKNQLRAYKTALSAIYPDKEILCALLWTDQPLLMPVSV